MMMRLHTWLDNQSLIDPVERRQASIFQIFLLVWFGIAALVWLVQYIVPRSPSPSSNQTFTGLLTATSVLLWLAPGLALWQLRRGQFRRSVATAALGLLLSQAIALIPLGISGSLLLIYMIPIVFVGLLASRRLLLTVSGLIMASVIIVSILQAQNAPMIGAFTRAVTGSNALDVALLLFFFIVVILLTVLVDQFGSSLRTALRLAIEREEELDHIAGELEHLVEARTAALRSALEDVEGRAAQQAALLGEIEQQRLTIRDLSVPVIPVSDRTLVVPLVGSLDNNRIAELQAQCLQSISRTAAHTLVLDITGVPVVDVEVAQGILATVRAAGMLGARISLVGVRPEVAQAIVALGINLLDVHTYSDLQSALAAA
jgi:anti-anti-sigma regulatory factor